MLPSLLSHLELCHLPDEQRALAECIGLDAYKRLLAAYGGDRIHIPKAKSVKRLVATFAVRYYTPTTAATVCRHIGISRKALRSILARDCSLRQPEPTLR